MFLIVSLTFLLALVYGNPTCISNERCTCIKNGFNFEFQCPPEITENRTVVHARPAFSKIIITCSKIPYLNEMYLPSVNLSKFDTVEIEDCPLPDGGFINIFDTFDIEVHQLIFYRKTDNSTMIKSEMFDNLTQLTRLNLQLNKLKSLDKSMFQKLSNLSKLILDGNLIDIKSDTFESAEKLTFLSLQGNEINFIEDDAFKSSNKLEKLYLCDNKLNKIYPGIFNGLYNLQTLELSVNVIEEILTDSFNDLISLKQLSLRRNLLRTISRDIFKSNLKVEEIRLDENKDLVLKDDVFSNFKALKSVSLAECSINKLNGDLFANSSNLKNIDLHDNNLTALPAGIFKGLSNLKDLSLNTNNIKELDDDLLADLVKLETLNLSNNKLTSINEKMFRNLKSLKVLNLNANSISSIHNEAFIGSSGLNSLDLNRNMYNFLNINPGDYMANFVSFSTPFSGLSALETLDLGHNKIDVFPRVLLTKLGKLKTLGLNHNNIRELEIDINWFGFRGDVNVANNNISHIDITDSLSEKSLGAAKLQIDRNPLICDCRALNLAKLARNDLALPVKIKDLKSVTCMTFPRFRNVRLVDVALEELVCALRDGTCTDSALCACKTRPYDQTLIVDCSNRNMTDYPVLTNVSKELGYSVSLDMRRNRIRSLNTSILRNYDDLVELNLNENLIDDVKSVPRNLKVLNLRNNQIKRIDAEFLSNLNGSRIRKLSLGNNPWQCDCELKDFMDFLRRNVLSNALNIDVNSIKCKHNNETLLNASEDEICSDRMDQLYAYVIIVVFCMLLVTSTTSIYYKYKQEIYIWLFARGWFLWLVSEEELDKDKPYDVFLSYSHKDEDFAESLRSTLEAGPQPYTLCVHYREFTPGEYISTQIASFIGKSRRTLVVLSKNFLSSVWGRAEFRQAHAEAMRDGRARLVVVLYGDIDENELDDELKAYFKTNTYIRWDDPWFWDRLRYALPHKKLRLGKGSRKHANVMRFIDDKFKISKRSDTVIA